MDVTAAADWFFRFWIAAVIARIGTGLNYRKVGLRVVPVFAAL
ncbi:hypothetical protein FHS97_003481 [Sphingomonas endophytica]|uniref:Uncharacterized protein n=1 Tax=Sphingomonas endophytica TaxID=869719 RepID=A0A7X0JBC2_9SPHN|nr:hypothetical protein [Sphingomonas endophytica]MBB6504099.1 hypothetical protein [Sphingomonas endophytica]